MSSNEYSVIEGLVSSQLGSYKGLPAEALLTCEEDFRAIFSCLPETQTWMELGSGHGLGPLLFASLNPHKRSIGIEFEEARWGISQKNKQMAGLSNVEYIHADLLVCDIPVADVYFLYFSTGPVLDRILFELGKRSASFQIVAIESHGDLLPRLEREHWLQKKQEIALKSSRHAPHAVIYEKCGHKESSLHDLSFQSKYILIVGEDGQSWLAESYGMEWVQGENFQLLTPPRTIRSSQVKNVFELNEVESKFHSALQLRKLGKLKICTSSGIKEEYLRKIFVTPSFKVEISSGEQVEWSDVKKIFWENTLCFDSSLDYFYYPHVV
jgi:hypothetical protein